MMNPEIFRQYDIRGVADRDLPDQTVLDLGRAIGTLLRRAGARQMTLGRDCRLSSDRIRGALVDGLLRTGIDVTDLGVTATPLLYYSLHALKPGGGVMITGSHNAGDYNGLKIAVGKSTIYGDQIQGLRTMVEEQDFEEGRGSLRVCPLTEAYCEYFGEHFGRLRRPLKIVVDCGNGTASDLAPRLYRAMGCEVVELFCEMDGRFPNHHPDPTVVENLQDLIARVRSSRADLGVAFDGDSDRIGAVDAEGRIVWGDHLMILYSREILKHHPGSAIIAEVKCSMNLYQDIQQRGGRGIMWQAGHSLIKAKMKEENALLAGEMSGHIFFADRNFGYDDALYAGARLLEIVAESDSSLSDLLSDVPPTFSTPELRVDLPEAIKFRVVSELQRQLSLEFETITVDGVRVVFDDGWGLVRASNTQPALVLRFEAATESRLKEIQELIERRLQVVRGQIEGDA